MKGADILTVGFGTTVAMWAIGYLSHLPVVSAPPALVLVLLLGALVAGGYVAGFRGERGVLGGVYGGALTGLLNLLVLGSFLATPERANGLVPAASIWIPGSLVVSSMLGAIGAWWGTRRHSASAAPDFTFGLAAVAVAATFLLIVAGGLVTGNKAGLAVADWPTSYGYNMFLYPFSRMTGGIYYEHAHRLLGALVGLTTVSLAIHLAMVESRRFVKGMAALAVVLVIAQGILGGLRVTERNLYLAVVHGVTAQVFLSLLVAIAVVLTATWRSGRPHRPSEHTGSERRMGTIAVAALVTQIGLGAIQRHLAAGLMLHIVSAFVVAALAIAAGVRAWGLHPEERVLKTSGLIVVYVTAAQLALGFSSWIAKGAWTVGTLSPEWTVLVTTLHQGTGALLLASTVTLRLWLSRLLG